MFNEIVHAAFGKHAASQRRQFVVLHPDPHTAYRQLLDVIGAGHRTAAGEPGQYERDRYNELINPEPWGAGFTHHPVKGEPTTGYQVAKYFGPKGTPQRLARAFHFDVSELSPEMIGKHLEVNKDHFEQPRYYQGAWYNPSTRQIDLEVSEHHANLLDAYKAAGDNAQQAIWDNANKQEYFTNTRLDPLYHGEDPDVPKDHEAWRKKYEPIHMAFGTVAPDFYKQTRLHEEHEKPEQAKAFDEAELNDGHEADVQRLRRERGFEASKHAQVLAELGQQRYQSRLHYYREAALLRARQAGVQLSEAQLNQEVLKAAEAYRAEAQRRLAALRQS